MNKTPMNDRERAIWAAGYDEAVRQMLEVESEGADRIAVERARQVVVEGYDAEHDHGHAEDLAWAAEAYLHDSAVLLQGDPETIAEELVGIPDNWPWAEVYWKPTRDPLRDLEKAGALIAAAIDALLADREPQGSGRVS